MVGSLRRIFEFIFSKRLYDRQYANKNIFFHTSYFLVILFCWSSWSIQLAPLVFIKLALCNMPVLFCTFTSIKYFRRAVAQPIFLVISNLRPFFSIFSFPLSHLLDVTSPLLTPQEAFQISTLVNKNKIKKIGHDWFVQSLT